MKSLRSRKTPASLTLTKDASWDFLRALVFLGATDLKQGIRTESVCGTARLPGAPHIALFAMCGLSSQSD